MKSTFAGLWVSIAVLGLVACNSNSTGNASNDAANTNASTQDYPSADTLHMTSEAGNYLDPRATNDSAAVVDPSTIRDSSKKK
ncbi:MAG: hypothetical protein M3342_19060 [Bacteroidota bacterium]|nr:hypothetical protein [Flavisolibacter sp.]MDQ3846082.1 hypothetical protein [Bacteroidota bacterium]MBD0297534.1 hypothetical protein [Flavisolibacter sp.]MBD0350062.1 hypothetical protein [Flavisolibacter sp.]MBD0364911.1 hypothetical protein [Flavisolibacter sp.]